MRKRTSYNTKAIECFESDRCIISNDFRLYNNSFGVLLILPVDEVRKFVKDLKSCKISIIFQSKHHKVSDCVLIPAEGELRYTTKEPFRESGKHFIYFEVSYNDYIDGGKKYTVETLETTDFSIVDISEEINLG